MGAAEALGGLQQNILGGSVGISQHVGIPQANDGPASAPEIYRPPLIIRHAIDVLTAVELDGQPSATARQIDDERRNDELPGQSRPVPRNAMPDREFSRRGIVAQFARSSRQLWIDTAAHVASVSWRAARANPPPSPPFQGGEFSRASRLYREW